MPYVNQNHIRIQDVQHLFYRYVERLGSFEDQANDAITQQLEIALANANNANFKILHPLLIRSYRMPTLKFRDNPINAIGLDIETDASNGRPMLLGFWHPESVQKYTHLFRPNLKTFFDKIRNNAENSPVANYITWGNLDIQCIIRLFSPTETERQRISRGLSANIKDGKFVGTPPVVRKVGKAIFYIAHYIPGRSIKLGYIEGGYEKTIWIFNCSQFYPGRIADTAKGLGLNWIDFPKNTHIVDWSKFQTSPTYHQTVIDSNMQDARVVGELVEILQTRFAQVFEAYPTLLVSTGSLTDAAVSKMLSGSKSEYQSNSWRWLTANVFNKLDRNDVAKTDTLLSECFSAGYVDQFAMGYFDSVCTADIAGAYPHKIRALPDLRYASLFVNSNQLEQDLTTVESLGWDIETAIIRGRVCIPETLKFHPITVKTYARENHRPIGEFYATYTLDERRFCEKYGATFHNEQYSIIGLSQRRPAPIATVSERLGEFRNRLLAEIDCPPNKLCDKCKMLDGQQYLIKVVDNSIYGKTVMTTEVVEDIDGSPQITGYIAGDRFNLLYGSLITARTRIQIAKACMQIVANGGKPIMTMTDSIYWTGTQDMLPSEMVRSEKTSGYFESPEIVRHFYLLKTGQYEYLDERKAKWHYKMRGLNVNWEMIYGETSFYRRTIKQHCSELSLTTHPKDVIVPVNTRRLISIGSQDLNNLAAIKEGITELRPFMLSSKQTEREVLQWRECLDGHIWFATPHLDLKSPDQSASTYPLEFLREMYEGNVELSENQRWRKMRISSARTSKRIDELKRLFIWGATERTKLPPPPGRSFRMTWFDLERWYGIARNEIIGERE